MKEKSTFRFILLFSIFVALVVGLLVRLYFMQIVNGEDYYQSTIKNYSHRFEEQAIRGNIYDSNGSILAYNVESFNLYLSKVYKSTEQLNEAIIYLMTILDDNQEISTNKLIYFYDVENKQFNSYRTEDEIANWQMNIDYFNQKEENIITDGELFFEFLQDYFKISESYTEKQVKQGIIIRYEILKNRWFWNEGEVLLISKDISKETLAMVTENRHKIKGLTIIPSMTREYGQVYDIAHVLGYVGMVTPEDVTESGYGTDDIIGKTGIEVFAEELLKGNHGYIDVITDETGTILSEVGGEKAINGSDIYLTIDVNLQKIAMESIQNNIEIIKNKAKVDDARNFADANAGAVVAIDIKTGEVLVMASYPSYDPNWFIHNTQESRDKIYEAFNDNIAKSMLNRAIQETYTPGSTFKPIVAIAGLEEKIIDEETKIFDPGHKVIGDWDFYCLEYVMSGYWFTHGWLDVKEAITTSCNMFFYILGVDTGIEAINNWAEQFGLGTKTGIDLYGEATGIRSNPVYKYSKEFEKWYIADTAQSSIGQLYHNYTPLQLANYTAALANGGKLFTPFLISKAVTKNGEVLYEGETQFKQIPWEEKTFKIIKEAMEGVVLDGTAEKVFADFPIKVAGKTGTAETGRESHESSNGVFICYAPIDDPQIAIAVVIEHGVWGSYTAPVAKDILREYFGLNYNK
ncbi:MAG: penicillin-binding protein 2 [Clostridiales bacterium]|nr:penicillin-binding protein 2 [Clostridiales bacterium]